MLILWKKYGKKYIIFVQNVKTVKKMKIIVEKVKLKCYNTTCLDKIIYKIVLYTHIV